MDLVEFKEKFPCKQARWYGEISYDLLRSYPEEVTQQFLIEIEAHVKYDLDKIHDAIIGNLVPVLYKDLPDYIVDEMMFNRDSFGMHQVEYKGCRLYIAKGAPKEWEKKLLYERLRRG